MRLKTYHLFILSACVFGFSLLAGCNRSQETTQGAVVALVNGETIHFLEIDKELEGANDGQIDPHMLNVLQKETLEQLIERRLLLQEAKKRGIEISEKEFKEWIDQFKKDYSEEDFVEQLKSKTLKKIDWEKEVREDYLVSKLLASAFPTSMTVTEEQILAYYKAYPQKFIRQEEVRARQIVVLDQEKAKTIRLQLLRGDDFTQVAIRNSISPDRIQGGDVGFFSKGEMPEEFDVVFSIEVGKISPVISSPYGYHIFKVEEKQNERVQPLEEAHNQIRKILTQQKQDRLLVEWLKELKTEAEIDVNTTLLSKNETSDL